MNVWKRTGLVKRLVLLALMACCVAGVASEKKSVKAGKYMVVGPYKYKNMTMYMIEGKETLPKDAEILTLGEAMEKKLVVVHETGDVNQLSVENVSKDKVIFIQAGDIVKGGKQDRVLSVDICLKPKSGKLPIASFCVEQGRWQQRGGEQLSKFSSSSSRASGKGLRNAIRSSKSGQSQVWANVAKDQKKLSDNLGKNVKSAKSQSSMQLTLEDKDLQKQTKEYVAKLNDIVKKNPKAIGYAMVVNGKFSTADIYGSRKLFEKVWPKMLEAGAVEAIADYDKKTESAVSDGKWLKELADTGKVKTRKKAVAKDFYNGMFENDSSVVNESADDKGVVYRFNMDAKQ